MKTQSRHELLAVIDEISEIAPNFRLGQLLAVLTGNTLLEGHPNAVYEIEDEDLLPAAREFLDSYRESRRDIDRINGTVISPGYREPVTVS